MARRRRLVFLAMLVAIVGQQEARSQDTAIAESNSSKLVEELDAGREKLTTIFQHDFVAGGLPPEYFSARDADLDQMQLRGDGLVMQVQGQQKWVSTNLNILFQLVGDFDVEARFTGLKFEGPNRSSAGMTVFLNDQHPSTSRFLRCRETDERQTARVSLMEILDDGSRDGEYNHEACEAMSGVLRLSRRGKTLYHLIAENDSSEFRLIGRRTITADPTSQKGLQLLVLSDGTLGDSSAEVVWKDVRVAAEKLLRIPQKTTPEIGSLYVLTFSDGTVKKIADPTPGMTQLGSAEWSGDGKTIVCDMSTGGVGTSRIIKMNADGSGFQDLGPGCMPSLSPDGQHIVYSVPKAGVMKMLADGSEAETIDGSGWGTQWSPDGKYIAWGRGRNVTVLNTETNEQTQLLTPALQRLVSHVYWNLGWSPDSKSIAFKSRGQDGKSQLFVADIDTPDGFKLLYSAPDIEEDMSWLPDNKTVIFTTKFQGRSDRHFATISRQPGAVVQDFPDVPKSLRVMNMDCSLDGKYLVFTGRPIPQPVEWTAK